MPCPPSVEAANRAELLRQSNAFGVLHLELYAAAQAAGESDLYELPTVRVSSFVFDPFAGNHSTTTTQFMPLLATGIAFQEAAKQLEVTPLARITSNL